MKSVAPRISGKRCIKTISRLERMGIRFAGTEKERQAADWIEGRLTRLGLENVHQQKFPCLSFSRSSQRLRVRMGSRWRRVECEVVAHSPSTTGKELRADLVLLEKVPDTLDGCREVIGGKAVLALNSELFDPARFPRVMEAQPAALIVVDDRFPNDWTVAIGLPRSWVDLITCPMVNVSHSDAWQMVKSGVRSIRLRLETRVVEASSTNVIGEIRGQGSSDEVIVISGHHDTVINSSGADDNLTGVASVLELARVFAGSRPARTLRFISFGAEEQLSEGAKQYVLSPQNLKGVQFVLNTDAIGGWMGRTEIYWTGPGELEALLQGVGEETDLSAHLREEISPFSDHFPFHLAGIPGVWYYRPTYQAARHYHHSRLEGMEVLSPQVLERTYRHQAILLERLAFADALPIDSTIPAGKTDELLRLGREWCGLDELPSRPGL